MPVAVSPITKYDMRLWQPNVPPVQTKTPVVQPQPSRISPLFNPLGQRNLWMKQAPPQPIVGTMAQYPVAPRNMPVAPKRFAEPPQIFVPKEEESKVKDIWDAFRRGFTGLVHTSKQNILATLPEILFPEQPVPTEPVYRPSTMRTISEQISRGGIKPEEIVKANEQSRIMRQKFYDIYDKQERQNQEWVASHPELQPRPEWSKPVIETVKANPYILTDPAYWGYIAAETLPFTLATMGATVGVTALTGNPILGMAVGLGISLPPIAEDLRRDLLENGATKEQAARLSALVAPVIGAVEVIGDLPVLASVSQPFKKLLFRNISKEIAKRTLGSLIGKGLKTFAIIEVSEILEEVAQQAIQDATIKTVNENRQILKGVSETIARTAIGTTPLALIGMGGELKAQISKGGVQIPEGLKEFITSEQGFIGEPPRPTPAEGVTPAPEVTTKRGKLTVNTSRGGIPLSYNIGGTFVGDKYFVGQNAVAISYGKDVGEYAVYDLSGKIIKGGFDKVSEAIQYAKAIRVTPIEPSVSPAERIAEKVEEKLEVTPAPEVTITPEKNPKVGKFSATGMGEPFTNLNITYKGEQVGRIGIDYYRNEKQILLHLLEVTKKGIANREFLRVLNTQIENYAHSIGAEKITLIGRPEDSQGAAYRSVGYVENASGVLEKILPSIPTAAPGMPEAGLQPEVVEATKPTEIIKPPVKPPTKPPAVVATPSQPEDVIKRFVTTINDPQNLRIVEADKAFLSKQKQARFDQFEKIIEANPNLSLEEASNRAKAALGGEYERKRLSLGDLFTPEERALLVNKIADVYPDKSNPEYLSHLEALVKALDEGIISNIPGRLGGSQRTRLEDIFGKPFVDALMQAKDKLGQAREPIPVEWREFPGRETGKQTFFPEAPELTLKLNQDLYDKYSSGTVTDPRSVEQQLLDKKLIELNTAKSLAQTSSARELIDIEIVKVISDYKYSPVVWVTFPKLTVYQQLRLLPPTSREKALATLKKIGINAVDVLNIPRSFITSFDISAVGRQGLQLNVAHPVLAGKNFVKMIKALASAKATTDYDNYVKSILYRAGERARKLYIAPIEVGKGLVELSKAEENFMSRLAQKIPGIKQSQRAYTTSLNLMRADVFRQGMEVMEKAGATQGDYDALANLINAASGRGTLPANLQSIAPVLNATLFSPRLVMSRLEYIPRLIQAYSTGNRVVAKEATRQIVSFLGFGLSVLGLYALWGGRVEKDPRSADYGKLVIGKTRIDIWAGYLQYVRFLSRLVTGITKTTGGYVNPQTRFETLMQFLQSKESPAMGLIVDILRGEAYGGEELALTRESLSQQAFNRLVPLAIQDMTDAIREEGTVKGIPIGVTSGLGIGVVTYTNQLSRLKNKVSQEIYKADYDSLNAKSKLIVDRMPEVKTATEKWEAQYARTSVGRQDINLRYRNQTRAVEKTYVNDITDAAREFQKTRNGSLFREKVNDAANGRRVNYESLNQNPDYKTIIDRMNQPLTPEQTASMSAEDIARIAYSKLLYADDMYDEFGNYNFDLADVRKTQFQQQYGKDALTYIEEYQGIKESDLPGEYKLLQNVRRMLRPYWEIEDTIWSMYPSTVKALSDQIYLLENTNPVLAKKMLTPAILRARNLIATYKKKMRDSNPLVRIAFDTFYK